MKLGFMENKNSLHWNFTHFLKTTIKNNQIHFSIPSNLRNYFQSNKLYSCLSLDGPYIAIGGLSELKKYPWNRVALTKELLEISWNKFSLSDYQIWHLLSNSIKDNSEVKDIALCLQMYPWWTYYELYIF